MSTVYLEHRDAHHVPGASSATEAQQLRAGGTDEFLKLSGSRLSPETPVGRSLIPLTFGRFSQ